MSELKPCPISCEAFMAAEKELNKFADQPKDFAIVNRRFAERLKKDQLFEPLHLYSEDVQPYYGEIGRYDCGGFKVRVVVNEIKTKEEWR